ncbi:glycosyl transferase family 3 [Salipiger aestuarii]|uniref:Anthranilate phosphoribosyltransferase n=1 Tax=Salipiger aestuarii TaxID=568098 RepID=A0A327XW89_9RHOB|nr:glycosyl transferase family protein [Salipiger aestuarii]KAA8609440.1 glycosyl transferase family 3 [Salipiger aestuarii]KAB2540986.1 glycosyl transferase family 3 [Salipiger aestuarii]RAK13268.1 anthranilate phosphoribosyltransferase [Salipiger aestuarii]
MTATPLGAHVRTLARGPGRSRALTRDEAEDAMRLMLSGNADPHAIGALLMLLRMKGETADEIAGFAHSAQQAMPRMPQPALDWPSYAAGRTRGLPWFLLSARLVADAGHTVLLHGWNGADGAVRAGLAPLGIPVADDPGDADRLIRARDIVYLPLERMSPALFGLLRLRDVLHLRSCVNTVCRMLNPGRAACSVQGVFHPPYRLLQQDAAQILGLRALTVIKGGGGEFERHPAKAIEGFGLRDGQPWDDIIPPLRPEDTRRLDDGETDPARLNAIWQGTLTDAFAEATVIGTAALALSTLGEQAPREAAQALWARRVVSAPN